jgi:integrase
MAGYQSGGRGTLIIQRTLPGFGRIRKASGTTNKDEFESIVNYLFQLAETGRHEPLQHIVDGTLTPLEVWQSQAKGMLVIPSHKTDILDISVEQWLTYHDVKPKTLKGYKSLWKAFRKGVPTGVHISTLPDFLRAYKAKKKAHPRMFNVTRNMFRAYAKATQGKYSDLYRAVESITPYVERPKQRGAPSPVGVWELEKARKDSWLTFKGLYLTGMGLKEWNATLVEEDDHYLIQGSKMERVDSRRTRKVPKIVEGLPSLPPRQEKALRHQIKKVNPDIQIYDARRGYARLLFESGVPEIRIEAYMGHQSASMTRKYAASAPDGFLVADAQAVRKYLKSQGISV